MKAIIFAAGCSSRLGELTKSLPKCCLKITEEETLIQRSLNLMSKNGIEEVIIVTGHAAVELQKEVQNWQRKFKRIELLHNPLFKERNNIYTAYLIREMLDSDTLIFNSDLVYHQAILEIAIKELKESEKSFFIVDDHKTLVDEDMKILLDSEKKIIRINKDLDNNICSGEYIGILRLANKDISIFQKSLETMIEREDFGKYYEDAIDEKLDKMSMSYVSSRGLAWSEIDTAEDYQRAKAKFSEQLSKS